MVEFLTQLKLDAIIAALLTTILTGLLKIPIKRLAERTKQSKKITKFITFLPIIIGFGVTALCAFLLTEEVRFDREFFVQWLSVVSLSLAIYAFWEKFVPSEKKILSEAEIKANQAVVEELQTKLLDTTVNVSESDATATESAKPTDEVQVLNHKKIILTNNKNN